MNEPKVFFIKKGGSQTLCRRASFFKGRKLIYRQHEVIWDYAVNINYLPSKKKQQPQQQKMIITFGAIFVDALLTIHLGKIPVHRKEIHHLVINELFSLY